MVFAKSRGRKQIDNTTRNQGGGGGGVQVLKPQKQEPANEPE